MDISVLITVLHTGQTSAGLEATLSKYIYDGKIPAEFHFSNKSPIYANRNYAVKYFLEKTKHTHLLFIDSDTFPLENPIKMAELNLDVVAGVYPMWKVDLFFWGAMRIQLDGTYRMLPPEERNGIKEVDACATGCMMIKREVLEKVKAPFLNDFNEDGTNNLGDDYAFCKRAKEAGFKVFVDWDMICDHFKTVPLLSIVKALKRSYEEGQKNPVKL
jgi:hypothetical protein